MNPERALTRARGRTGWPGRGAVFTVRRIPDRVSTQGCGEAGVNAAPCTPAPGHFFPYPSISYARARGGSILFRITQANTHDARVVQDERVPRSWYARAIYACA